MLNVNLTENILKSMQKQETTCFRHCFSYNDMQDNWEQLNRILRNGRLTYPRMRLVTNGSPVHNDYISFFSRPNDHHIPMLNLPTFYSHLSDGATLIIDSIEEFIVPISDLLDNLSSRSSSVSQANGFLCFREAPGIGVHRDDHDVVVLQLIGEKRWTVFDRSSTLEEARSIGPVFDDVIRAGDILVVPEGAWHDVRGVNAPSFHISIGVFRPSLAALAKFALETADLGGEPEEQLIGIGTSAAQAALSRVGVLEEYLSSRERPLVSLPHAIVDVQLPGYRIVKPSSAHFKIADSNYPETKYLVVGQYVAQVSSLLATDLVACFTQEGCSYDQLLATAAAPAELAVSISELTAAGLLTQIIKP